MKGKQVSYLKLRAGQHMAGFSFFGEGSRKGVGIVCYK
jgi:hypothetical protein